MDEHKTGLVVEETAKIDSSPIERHTYIFESEERGEPRLFTNDIRVEQVTDVDNFKTFYHVPFQIYKDNPYWVAPFWREQQDFFRTRNPFWSHAECVLFLARKDNEVVGRIAAIIDHTFCKTVGQNIGYFGFFECIDDFDCASTLWRTAEQYLLSKGMKVMRGPIDGRIDVGCGFLYLGFSSRPSLLSSYSPPYYMTLAEKFGLVKTRDLFDYYIDLTQPIPGALKQKADQCMALGITARPFHRFRTTKELDWWVPLFLETFSDHWGYVPVSPQEVTTRFGIKQLRWIVDPRLFVIAEAKGEPIAYLWATPDFNQLFQKMNGRLGPVQYLRFLLMKRRITIGKLHLIGIKQAFRHHHVASYLNYIVLVEMKRRGFVGAEVGLIDEGNALAQQTIALTGATVYKKHRVFEKPLEPSDQSTLARKGGDNEPR